MSSEDWLAIIRLGKPFFPPLYIISREYCLLTSYVALNLSLSSTVVAPVAPMETPRAPFLLVYAVVRVVSVR